MEDRHVDPASLSAAVVAGALALLIPKGPFDSLGSVIGLTLALLVIAWNKDLKRSFVQSLAYSSVLALVLVLFAGFFLQFAFRSPELSANFVTGAWLVLFALATIWERLTQRKLTRLSSDQPLKRALADKK